jgi:uncharacterized protein (DUF302 family)
MSFLTATSAYPVDQTVTRLRGAIERRGITVFAQVDHAAASREAGLELADEQVLIFGDPRAGTLLMQDDARVGYELPLRLLVWSDGATMTIGYRQPAELGERYELDGHVEVLERMAGLLGRLIEEATGQE